MKVSHANCGENSNSKTSYIYIESYSWKLKTFHLCVFLHLHSSISSCYVLCVCLHSFLCVCIYVYLCVYMYLCIYAQIYKFSLLCPFCCSMSLQDWLTWGLIPGRGWFSQSLAVYNSSSKAGPHEILFLQEKHVTMCCAPACIDSALL